MLWGKFKKMGKKAKLKKTRKQINSAQILLERYGDFNNFVISNHSYLINQLSDFAYKNYKENGKGVVLLNLTFDKDNQGIATQYSYSEIPKENYPGMPEELSFLIEAIEDCDYEYDFLVTGSRYFNNTGEVQVTSLPLKGSCDDFKEVVSRRINQARNRERRRLEF